MMNSNLLFKLNTLHSIVGTAFVIVLFSLLLPLLWKSLPQYSKEKKVRLWQIFGWLLGLFIVGGILLDISAVGVMVQEAENTEYSKTAKYVLLMFTNVIGRVENLVRSLVLISPIVLPIVHELIYAKRSIKLSLLLMVCPWFIFSILAIFLENLEMLLSMSFVLIVHGPLILASSVFLFFSQKKQSYAKAVFIIGLLLSAAALMYI